jgi:DNA-binding transcriptional ArsR family regulator
MSPASAPEPAAVFAALGDATRWNLVFRLSGSGPLPIVQLAADSGMTRQAITKHLHVLEAAGLARSRRRGREQLWELTPEQIRNMQRNLDLIARSWDDAMDRLAAMVEEPTETP